MHVVDARGRVVTSRTHPRLLGLHGTLDADGEPEIGGLPYVISALVAASEVAYLMLKLVGACVLIWIGVQSLRRSGEPVEARRSSTRPFRDGVVTSLSNPKLAVFFVALFPQFVDAGAPVLPATLLMAAMLAIFDFAWYTSLAVMVSRARQTFVRSRVGRWVERTTGAILIALGVRVAIEQR